MEVLGDTSYGLYDDVIVHVYSWLITDLSVGSVIYVLGPVYRYVLPLGYI